MLESLLDNIVKWSITGEVITKDKVIAQLGLADRFEDKLSHYFRVVDEKYYVPNLDLLSRLSRAIKELNGGYIFVEGLPGIGKSTALTKFKEENPDITLAYYCFIPDAQNDFGELRHKANYFVKSLCVAIENNFPDVDLPNRYSDKYEEKLSLYIDRLGQLDKKIIFLIDGLDHVHRDLEFNENSLLNQIKGKLPEGVFFLLSAQYKSVLSQSVELEVESDSRRYIKVPQFTQQEIHQYLSNKGILVKDDVLDHIEKVSNGIPLYLHYISELLIHTRTGRYEEILKSLPGLTDGRINLYHEYLFKKIEKNETIKWTLAVLAYRKENSSIDTIAEILRLSGLDVNISDIQQIINDYSHLLRQADGRSYSIFHNSFREFIISKTLDLKGEFNKALVAFYENAPFSDDAYRNYFRHLFEIGAFQKIIEATSLEWVKTAWANFRSLQEIKDNIAIALNACVELISLEEFIRIGFIKAQVGRLSWNIENSEIDFPSLFLRAGLISNSIRAIWDGDFILTSKEYFAYFLSEYYSKTGNQLPHQVLKQGFAKKLNNANSESLTRIYQAKALACDDIRLLFEDIDKIKWVKSKDHQVNYIEEPYKKKENAKINLKIKIKIIDYLYENKLFKHLLALSKAYEGGDKLGVKIQISLSKLLMPVEKASAIRTLKKVDLNKLTDKVFLELICFSSDYLTDDEIKEFFGERPVPLPNLHKEVVNKDNVPYGFRRDVVEFFELLKPVWIYQSESIPVLQLRVSTLPSPAKNFYGSILGFSELWYLNRHQKIAESERIIRIKQSLNELYVRRHKGLKKVSPGLFDYSNDDYYIASSIDKIFKKIFTYIVETSSDQSVEEIVQHWFKLEEGEDGYRGYKVALGIAGAVHKSKHQNLTDLVYRLLQHAETQVRQEEETATLLSNLGNVAEIYGSCGFREDFERIYNQLIEIAFGVAHRKDYQASYILTPLEMMHEVDPEGTLPRLKEVFDIQNQLADAGNARMHHICLSELIAFTAKHSPELAFMLLEKEESNLGRAEAIDIVVEPLIKSSSASNLRMFLSLIKTLPRWESGGTRENFFLTLAATLLERAIELNEEAFIHVLLDEVKYNAIVELEAQNELDRFSELLFKYGKEYSQYGLPSPGKQKTETATPKKKLPQGEKFSISHSKPDVDTLIRLFEDSYAEFEKVLNESFTVGLKNRRNQTFRNEYYRSKPIFEKFYKTYLDPSFSADSTNAYRLIRYFIEFKNEVIKVNAEGFLKASELEEGFNNFIAKANLLFPNDALNTFLEKEFILDKWIENILQFINEHRDHVFSQVVSEEELYRLVKEISILEFENLMKFVNKWTSGKITSSVMLLIATRLFPFSPKEAKELLLSLVDAGDNLFFQKKDSQLDPSSDVIEAFILNDPIVGKKFLLKSYLLQKGNYDDSFISGLDSLLKYKQYFDNDKAIRAYYGANFLYNKELATGLPLKKNEYEFISEHQENLGFSEIIIRHLVNLFDYPVVKIREQALQSLFDLVVENTQYLDKVIEYGIVNGSDNKVEHSLVLFNSLSLIMPENLLSYKNDLIKILSRSHFNILESLKEILLRIDNYSTGFLSQVEKTLLQKLNTEVPIWYDRLLTNNKKGKNFIFSEYQASLLSEIYKNEADDSDIQDDVYTDLVNKGLDDYSHEQEGQVHRRYNINTNFDAIEINSPYYDEIQSSINQIFKSKIKRACFEPDFIFNIKKEFRLYDPSKLLYKVRHRPDYINWLPERISETDFINFSDFDTLKASFVHRENDYITLFEYGSQRPGDSYTENHFTSYFEIYAYLKKKEFDEIILDSRLNKLEPVIKEENLYAYEISTLSIPSTSFPIKGIQPLLEISYNKFRGESDLANAFILADLLNELNIKEANLLEVLMGKGNYPLEAFRWQNAYTSGTGRRRYKATSEGFILKIKKDVLLDYINKNGLTLCYDFALRRSISKFIPERYMEWYNLRKRVEVSF